MVPAPTVRYFCRPYLILPSVPYRLVPCCFAVELPCQAVFFGCFCERTYARFIFRVLWWFSVSFWKRTYARFDFGGLAMVTQEADPCAFFQITF